MDEPNDSLPLVDLTAEQRLLLLPWAERIRASQAAVREVERQAAAAVQAARGQVEEARGDFIRACQLVYGVRKGMSVNPDTFAVSLLPPAPEEPA